MDYDFEQLSDEESDEDFVPAEENENDEDDDEELDVGSSEVPAETDDLIDYLLYRVDSVSHPPSRAASLCWTHVYMQGGQLLG